LVVISSVTNDQTVEEPFDTPINIGVQDVYNQLVLSDNSTIISVTLNGDGEVEGSSVQRVVNGIATFSYLTVYSTPGTSITLEFTGTSLQSTSINVMLANCTPGYQMSGRSCVECVAGTFKNESEFCEPCPPGSISSNSGATSCDFCNDGQVQPNNGYSSCYDCLAGTYAVNSTDCELCPAGTFSSSSRSTSCSPCTPGYITEISGLTKCSSCAEGTYSENGTACVPCPEGTYSSLPAQKECLPCSPGYIASGKQQTSCSPCDAGYYSINSTWCSECEPGAFSPSSGFSSCISCAAGTVASDFGLPGCSICPKGSFSPNVTSCLPCSPGIFSFTTFHFTFFDLIFLSGTFSPDDGQSLCQTCPPQMISPSERSISCVPCANGFYSLDGVVCEECPVGCECSGDTPLDASPGIIILK
jgi:hypothetical protein